MLELPVVDDEKVGSSSRRSGIMLCYPFEEKRLHTWKPPYIIQPKLDGVRCRAIIKDNNVMLASSENHFIDHVPHIEEALKKSFPDMEIELDGELYTHGMSFQDIISITSRSRNKHINSEKMEYHIFDIVTNKEQVDRTSMLNALGYHFIDERIRVVPASLVRNMEEIMEKFDQYLTDGYEGFVIRDTYGQYHRKRYTGMMKFKPHQIDEYVILGTIEEISIDGFPKNSLGAFVCTSTEGTIFNVGTGLTAEQRHDFWRHREELVGKKLKVKYQALTQGKGVPRFPVALEVK
jgi:ATP-dependent DNA ligase